jgi:hypothetical protein
MALISRTKDSNLNTLYTELFDLELKALLGKYKAKISLGDTYSCGETPAIEIEINDGTLIHTYEYED